MNETKKYSNTNTVSTNKVPFSIPSKEFLDYLEHTFFENTQVLEPNQMYYQAGQRSVLQHIKLQIELAKKKTGV